MARPLRIEIAGGVYHVTTRGGERRDVVRDDQDRISKLVRQAARRRQEDCPWDRLLRTFEKKLAGSLEKYKVKTWHQGCLVGTRG
jgi:hypothetical protein